MTAQQYIIQKSSKETFPTLRSCIEQAQDNKPGGEDNVLFIKDTPTAIKFPDLAEGPARLKTFENWPKYMTPTPKSLVDAGFYYKGTSDRVQCHYCGIILVNWKPDDIPVNEHLTHSNNCDFIKQHKPVRHILQDLML